MTKTIEFAKLSGSGNDFICIDNRDGRFDELLASPELVGRFAKSLCDRGKGIGADGVIFACEPDIEGVSDIAAVFYEADGSSAALCGNGTGCFIHWVFSNGWVAEPGVRILTEAGVVRGSNSDGDYVRVCIPDPEDLRMDFDLVAKGKSWKCDYVVTGVPHLITYVDDVADVDMEHWGPALRFHEQFQPRGVNANFVHVLEPGRLAIRTWEFGVEGETLACGTGSAAAAILATRRFGWPVPHADAGRPVYLRSQSGDTLRVYFATDADGGVIDVCIETVVRFLFEGAVHRELATKALGAGRTCSACCGDG